MGVQQTQIRAYSWSNYGALEAETLSCSPNRLNEILRDTFRAKRRAARAEAGQRICQCTKPFL